MLQDGAAQGYSGSVRERLVPGDGRGLARRDFLKAMAVSAGFMAVGGLGAVGCDRPPTGPEEPDLDGLLRVPDDASVAALTLLSAPGIAGIGRGQTAPAWLFNGRLPGPTIRARRGDSARITLINQLPEETIVHWHGLLVPEEADGHPRYAVPPGATYQYEFTVDQRAGTHWYHPHAHHLTAGQLHRGLAGFFIVRDDEEDALPLPRGVREILLMIQDRRAAGGALSYRPTGDDHVAGFLGDVPFGNGIQMPRLTVTADRYRFRILNASNARVYRLALSTGAPLTVIGNDGGLLPAAVEVESVHLGVAERIDLIIDLSGNTVGERLKLTSLPFQTFGSSGGASPQGMAMDLLELEVIGGGGALDAPLPSVLSNIPTLLPADATRERTFEFRSLGGGQSHPHVINDQSFDMNRVDEQVQLGELERWIFRNSSALPHPVHLHGTHFRLLSRSGGRNAVYPYEGGLKDTVLLMPTEEVEVLVRFDAYRGIFPLHCHNMQHEDMGMMLNIEVV